MESNFIEAIDKLEDSIKFVLKKIDYNLHKDIQEIKIRSNRPLMIKIFSRNYYVDNLSNIKLNETSNLYIVTQNQLQESFKRICEYSIYAYQEQINNGFITLKGGHRVGICGTAVFHNHEIVNIKDISSINLRIARFIPDVANELINKTMKDGLIGLLICGKPGSGKTTLLKDIIRQISSGRLGEIYNVSVIDERGEISGGCNELNKRSYLGYSVDIFDGYLKATGMMMAIRTMAPDLIVCDEIGTKEETEAIENALNSGVKIISTIHAGSEEEIYMKPQIKKLISSKAFEKIAILSSGKEPGQLSKIIEVK